MKRIFKVVLMVVLTANILVIDGFIFWNLKKENTDSLVKNNECSLDCKELISQKIIELLPTATEISPTPSKIPAPTIKTASVVLLQKTKNTQYIPIPGNGNTLENKWTDLPGTEFYISTDDYSNLTEAYFEANMKLINGNGLAYVRLFDITAGIEVWGSEISTGSQSFTSVSSGKITLRSGTHLYRVQAKSLTADTTVFNSGRIKIILEN